MHTRFCTLVGQKFVESGMSLAGYAKYIGINRGSFRNHIRGVVYPQVGVLRKYASKWGMNVGDLVDMIKSERGY